MRVPRFPFPPLLLLPSRLWSRPGLNMCVCVSALTGGATHLTPAEIKLQVSERCEWMRCRVNHWTRPPKHPTTQPPDHLTTHIAHNICHALSLKSGKCDVSADSEHWSQNAKFVAKVWATCQKPTWRFLVPVFGGIICSRSVIKCGKWTLFPLTGDLKFSETV